MNWAKTWAWLQGQKNPPADLLRYAEPRAFKKVRVAKPAIRYPKGTDKRTNRKILENQLDDLCRALYKKRDIKEGWAPCISCQKPKLARDLQWGHFIAQGQSQYLRWDPRNFWAQCVSCNMFQQGKQADYGAELDRRHYPGFSEGLRQEARRYKAWHPSIEDLKEKVKGLKKIIEDLP